MKKRSNSKSFEIALSAISCAIATLFLSLGILNSYLLTFGYLMACIALCLPLTKRFWAGDILAYVAACLLTLLIGGGAAFFWRLLPFIMFFGLYPVATYAQFRFKINIWLARVIKAVWLAGTLVVVWIYVFGMAAGPEFLRDYMLPIVIVGGVVISGFFDFAMIKLQTLMTNFIARIKKN